MKQKDPIAFDRRQFLAMSGMGLAGIWLSPLLGGCDDHVITPFGTESGASFITPNARFFVQNGGEGAIPGWSQPTFASASDWTLTIRSGGETTVFRYADLMSLANDPANVATLMKTIECILQSDVRTTATGYAGNAWWTGVRLTRVLDEVGIFYGDTSPIVQLNLTGADGFVNNIPTERLLRDDLPEPILAWRMNGEELPPEHGFPVRLIIQEGYGYKNVKWLTGIDTATFLSDIGTYQSQGYVDDGIIRVNSRSTTLFDRITLSSGPTLIRGFATSGFGAIEKVEVSIDGGTPQTARIVPVDELAGNGTLPQEVLDFIEERGYPTLGVWTFWEYAWEADAGDHVIEIRAYDTAGNQQPDTDENERDGLTAVTRYRVEVG